MERRAALVLNEDFLQENAKTERGHFGLRGCTLETLRSY
jgi:hypothetical protein